MKASLPEDKLPCLEEGSLRHDNESKMSHFNPFEKHNGCSQLTRIVKVIFYLELMFFIGWAGCLFLSSPTIDNNYNDSKSETIRACGSSVVKCASSNINNKISYQPGVTRNRDKRSSEENNPEREKCLRNVNATRESMNQLAKQLIIGEDSDPSVSQLRANCIQRMGDLTIHLTAMAVISNTNSFSPTDEEWNNFILDIKQGILNDTNSEHREQIEASGPLTQEIQSEFRTTIESFIRLYKKCERILPFGPSSKIPSMADILNERERCGNHADKLKEDVRSLAALIVPGDPAVPEILQLRNIAAEEIIEMMNNLTDGQEHIWTVPLILAQLENLSDETWESFIDIIKSKIMNSTDSEIRGQELRESATPEMVNKFRSVVYNYLNNVVNCNAIKTTINEFREHINNTQPRI